MMLAACLDAADSLPAHALHLLPFSDGIQSSTNGSETKNSDVLLAQITRALEEGLPELKGEFQLTSKRVWRGLGQIAAKKVDVDSIYNHEAAPVPGAEKRQNREENVEDSQQNHSHEHSHEHKHEHQHQHSHDHKNERGEASGQNLAHSHSHNHFTNEGPGVENALKQEEGAKEDPLFLGHSHNHGHSHSHEHNHNHTHSHDHDHSHNHSLSHNHSHDHASYSKLRNLPEITKMLRNAPPSHIPKRVATLAIEAFTALAHAEKNTHGASSIDQVHFHEVGAVDSIVDTVGTLLGLYYLGVDLGSDEHDKNIVIDGRGKKCAITCSRLPLGEGTVWTDHGLLPVPAPATMHLLVGMPTCPGPAGVTGELVTPTAAALLRVVTGVHDRERGDVVCMGEGGGFWKPRELDGRPPCWTPRAVGLGAGSKNFERHPNILRLLLGDGLEQQKYHDIAVEVPLEAAKDGRENDAGKNMKKESDEVEQTEEGKNNAALQTRAAVRMMRSDSMLSCDAYSLMLIFLSA